MTGADWLPSVFPETDQRRFCVFSPVLPASGAATPLSMADFDGSETLLRLHMAPFPQYAKHEPCNSNAYNRRFPPFSRVAQTWNATCVDDYGWLHKSRLRCQTVLLPAGSLIRFIIVECDFSVGFLIKLDVSVHVDFFYDPGFALQLALHLEFVEAVTSVHAT